MQHKTESTKLLPSERVQAAWRILDPFSKGTESSVCRRYQITPTQLKRAVTDFKKHRFTKSKNWNPVWDREDVIHHVVDTSVMVDIVHGSEKGSDVDLLLDNNFDPVNGILHVQWTDDDKLALLEGLPYRMLEILRDSTPGDELYQEALEFMECTLFKAICKAFGIDRDVLLISALEITKADL